MAQSTVVVIIIAEENIVNCVSVRQTVDIVVQERVIFHVNEKTKIAV